MEFTIRKMDTETAVEILGWSYEAPYNIYNNGVSEESLGELLDGSYQAVFEEGRLFGFLCAGKAAQVPKGMSEGVYPEGFIDIGIGMDPGLTGQGKGQQFFGFAVSTIQNQYPDLRLRLTVAEFNKRAIHLYKKFGFIEARRISTDSTDFITMEKRDGGVEEITSPAMPDEVCILLAYAASAERAALEYEKYITLPNRRLYGAAENGELAGCIGIECRSPEEMEIRHISVAPDARGKGFGHAMIKAVQEKLQPNVIVAETDREAIGFYRSIGFDIQSLGEKYPGVERFSCRLGKAGS